MIIEFDKKYMPFTEMQSIMDTLVCEEKYQHLVWGYTLYPVYDSEFSGVFSFLVENIRKGNIVLNIFDNSIKLEKQVLDKFVVVHGFDMEGKKLFLSFPNQAQEWNSCWIDADKYITISRKGYEQNDIYFRCNTISSI